MTDALKITQERNYNTIQNEIEKLKNEVAECSSNTAYTTQDITRKIARALRYDVLTRPQAKMLHEQVINQSIEFVKKCNCRKK